MYLQEGEKRERERERKRERGELIFLIIHACILSCATHFIVYKGTQTNPSKKKNFFSR